MIFKYVVIFIKLKKKQKTRFRKEKGLVKSYPKVPDTRFSKYGKGT